MHAAREQEALGLQASALDPRLDHLTGWRRDLKLHRTLRLLLQDDRPRGNSIAMAHITHSQLHQIAGAQFAIDAQVEQCEFAQPSLPVRITVEAAAALRRSAP